MAVEGTRVVVVNGYPLWYGGKVGVAYEDRGDYVTVKLTMPPITPLPEGDKE